MLSKFAKVFAFFMMVSTVLTFSVIPGHTQSIRFWGKPVEEQLLAARMANDFDGRMKREMYEWPEEASAAAAHYNKRSNLKRLVLLSARGFGKK